MVLQDWIKENYKNFSEKRVLCKTLEKISGKSYNSCYKAMHHVLQKNDEVKQHFNNLNTTEEQNGQIPGQPLNIWLENNSDSIIIPKQIEGALSKIPDNWIMDEREFIQFANLNGKPYRRFLDNNKYDKYRGKKNGKIIYSTPENITFLKNQLDIS